MSDKPETNGDLQIAHYNAIHRKDKQEAERTEKVLNIRGTFKVCKNPITWNNKMTKQERKEMGID